jgi:hypothetical protein
VKYVRPHFTRKLFSDVFDVAGIGCLVGAGWAWIPIVGVALLGVALLLVGWVVGGNESDATRG